MTAAEATTGLTVVCVFNDPDVRRECLDRSLAAYSGTVPFELVAVDNTTHAFPTAGAALGSGVERARYDVVVLVHQDVYLHDVDRLAEIAALLRKDRSWGLVGANGVTADGRSTGLLRDRMQLIGDSAPQPVEVDSLDEVLVMVRRDLLLEHPLTQDPDLAWHAYAVELGLRHKRLGLRVGAVDAAITHNSLTVNLARLDVAHRRVAQLYPERGAIRTTCGTVRASQPRWQRSGLVRHHGWRLRWLRLSGRSWHLRRVVDVPVVLSDIRHEVDLLLAADQASLELVNLDRTGRFARAAGAAVTLTRRQHPVTMCAVDGVPALVDLLATLPADGRVLLDGLAAEDIAVVVEADPGRTWLVGLQLTGPWLLGGPEVDKLPTEWTRRPSVPLALRRSLV